MVVGIFEKALVTLVGVSITICLGVACQVLNTLDIFGNSRPLFEISLGRQPLVVVGKRAQVGAARCVHG